MKHKENAESLAVVCIYIDILTNKWNSPTRPIVFKQRKRIYRSIFIWQIIEFLMFSNILYSFIITNLNIKLINLKDKLIKKLACPFCAQKEMIDTD